MIETKIKGLKILLDDDYIEIIDAYQINNKQKMEEIIEEAMNKIEFCNIKRSMKSMVRQWALVNRLYRWHIFKKKNSKCKIKNKISLLIKILSFFLGFQQIRFAKFKKRLEKKKMSEISLGTKYDINKQAYSKSPILTDGVLNSKKEIIKNYLRKTQSNYYMLLRKEVSNYTLFRIDPLKGDLDFQYNELINILVDECLKPRGDIKDIDYDESKTALEMWLTNAEDTEDETKTFVYMFFPCDPLVIEV